MTEAMAHTQPHRRQANKQPQEGLALRWSEVDLHCPKESANNLYPRSPISLLTVAPEVDSPCLWESSFVKRGTDL